MMGATLSFLLVLLCIAVVAAFLRIIAKAMFKGMVFLLRTYHDKNYEPEPDDVNDPITPLMILCMLVWVIFIACLIVDITAILSSN